MCMTHYQQKRRRRMGVPARRFVPADPRVYICERVIVRPGGCWEWQQGCDRDGYGIGRVDGRKSAAHRISHEAFIGPIPNGFHVDHLCSNPPCVNPAHLEAVTPRENTRRSTNFIGQMIRNPAPKLVPAAPDGHGTIAAYQGKRKCRCDDCREANRIYMRQYRINKGIAVGPERGPYPAVRVKRGVVSATRPGPDHLIVTTERGSA